jgi:Ca2+-binding EF-hand superfamily protein
MMRMPPKQKMTDLFNRIDTNGSGTISKGQLQQAFQATEASPCTRRPASGFRMWL